VNEISLKKFHVVLRVGDQEIVEAHDWNTSEGDLQLTIDGSVVAIFRDWSYFKIVK
jgi:hypothetical protein